MADRIPGARLEVFESSSHCPFLEEPEAFNSALERFLAEL
jgi:pimeloyl-ACP methyl ester carboxylesterase